jgi:hypothetical protein
MCDIKQEMPYLSTLNGLPFTVSSVNVYLHEAVRLLAVRCICCTDVSL